MNKQELANEIVKSQKANAMLNPLSERLESSYKMPIGIQRKIDEANELMMLVSELDETPTTYGGGTWPHYVDINEAISVKGKYVYINWTDRVYNLERKKERYNVNKVSYFGDDYCRKNLIYTLNLIIKTYKKALKG